MENANELSRDSGASESFQSFRLNDEFSELPQQTGKSIADMQIKAITESYAERMGEGISLFTNACLTDLPEEIGYAAADLKLDGMRSAMLGLLWRLPLIGGAAFSGCLLFGFGFGVAAIALVASVPVSCFLVIV